MSNALYANYFSPFAVLDQNEQITALEKLHRTLSRVHHIIHHVVFKRCTSAFMVIANSIKANPKFTFFSYRFPKYAYILKTPQDILRNISS